MAEAAHTTIDQAEVDHFSRIAAEWWNHKVNSVHCINSTQHV